MSDLCPECGSEMTDGVCMLCDAGGDKPGTPKAPPMPTQEDLVQRFTRAFARIPRDAWPGRMRHDEALTPHDAARWWLRIIGPHHRNEGPRKRVKKDGTIVWDWPYRDRIRFLFLRFVGLDETFQDYIIAASEDGVYWRGDDLTFFRLVVEETERMRKDPETYKASARALLSRVTSEKRVQPHEEDPK